MTPASSEPELLNVIMSVVGAMFGLLCLLLGWVGAGMHRKLDVMGEKLSLMAGELHTRINHIDNRLTKVETRCAYEHDPQK